MLHTTNTFFLVLLLTPFFSFGWDVSPSSNTITHKGPSYFFLKVSAEENTSAIPIEVYPVKRLIDQKGVETHERVDDQFFIYPSQFMLEPKSVQRIRVQWKGSALKIKEELAYRIIVEGAPVEAPKQQVNEKITVGITLLKTFVTSLYILPKHGNHKLNITSHTVREEKGKKELVIHLHNEGNAHITFSKPTITLSHEAEDYVFDPEEVKKTIGTVVVLPGNRRELTIPLRENFPKNFPLKKAKVSITLPKKK